MIEQLKANERRTRRLFITLALSLAVACVVVNFCLFRGADLFLGQKNPVGFIFLFVGLTLSVTAVPITHLTGKILHGRYDFYQPWKGGSDYVLLQAFAWIFYSLGILTVIFALLFDGDRIGIITLSGILEALAQVLITCSLLVYDLDSSTRTERTPSEEMHLGEIDDNLWISKSQYNVVHLLKIDSGTTCFALFVLLNLSLLSCPIVLIFFRDSTLKTNEKADYISCILSVLFTLWITNKVGLRLYSKSAGASILNPFVGGVRFCFLQTLTWSLITCTATFQALLISEVFTLRKLVLTQNVALTSAEISVLAALTAHFCLILSIRSFSPLEEDEEEEDNRLEIKDSSKNQTETENPGENENKRKEKPKYKLNLTSKELNEVNSIARKYLFEKLSPSHSTSLTENKVKTYSNFIKETENVMKVNKYDFLTHLMVFVALNTHLTVLIVSYLFIYFSFPIYSLLNTFSSSSSSYDNETNNELQVEQEQLWTDSNIKQVYLCFIIPLCASVVANTVVSSFKINQPFIKHIFSLNAYLVPSTIGLSFLKYNTHLFNICLFWDILHAYPLILCRNKPEVNGSREWKYILSTNLGQKMSKYYGFKLKVNSETIQYFKPTIANKGEEQKPVIIGFHPHGILPITIGWLPFTDMWKYYFPELKVRGHTASVLHNVPLLRDLSQWLGMRDVSRSTVETSLQNGISPLIAIGGQKEMFLSSSKTKTIKLFTGHKGFIKLAFKHGVNILPVFSFGEHKLLDNVDMPSVQNYVKDRVGFPFPFFPIGRWYLPMHRKTRLTVCIGKVIKPSRKTDNPTNDEIISLHQDYLQALKYTFEENKVSCGYPTHSLQFLS